MEAMAPGAAAVGEAGVGSGDAGGCGVGPGPGPGSGAWCRDEGSSGPGCRIRHGGASLHRAHHRLLRFGRTALGLAGSLLGLGDAFLHLSQALPALLRLRFQLREALRLGGATLRRFGPLLDLAQALLRFLQRALLDLPLLLRGSVRRSADRQPERAARVGLHPCSASSGRPGRRPRALRPRAGCARPPGCDGRPRRGSAPPRAGSPPPLREPSLPRRRGRRRSAPAKRHRPPEAARGRSARRAPVRAEPRAWERRAALPPVPVARAARAAGPRRPELHAAAARAHARPAQRRAAAPPSPLPSAAAARRRDPCRASPPSLPCGASPPLGGALRCSSRAARCCSRAFWRFSFAPSGCAGRRAAEPMRARRRRGGWEPAGGGVAGSSAVWAAADPATGGADGAAACFFFAFSLLRRWVTLTTSSNSRIADQEPGDEVLDVVAHVIPGLVRKGFGLGLGGNDKGKRCEPGDRREQEQTVAHAPASFHVRRVMQALRRPVPQPMFDSAHRAHRIRPLKSRSTSRRTSRSAISRRRSRPSLPRARASSTFARDPLK